MPTPQAAGFTFLEALRVPRRPLTTTPEVAAIPARLTVFDLDTLKPVGEISGVGGNGTAVDPKTGHGFTSDHPKVSMFDTKTLTLIKSIDVGSTRPDGIYFDPFNERVYVFSHPTKDATVIDAKDGTVLGTIDLGGVPEQGVGDGKGMLYVVMQDAIGSVTAVDVTTMKAVGHYSFVDKGGCNGLAIDVKNDILFAACSRSATTPPTPQPTMVILSAKDGKILANLPLAGGSDGAVFNPATMEAFSTPRQRHYDDCERKEPDQLRGGAEPANDEWRSNHHIRQQDWPSIHHVSRARTCSASCVHGNRTADAKWPPATGPADTRFLHHPDDWHGPVTRTSQYLIEGKAALLTLPHRSNRQFPGDY